MRYIQTLALLAAVALTGCGTIGSIEGKLCKDDVCASSKITFKDPEQKKGGEAK